MAMAPQCVLKRQQFSSEKENKIFPDPLSKFITEEDQLHVSYLGNGLPSKI